MEKKLSEQKRQEAKLLSLLRGSSSSEEEKEEDFASSATQTNQETSSGVTRGLPETNNSPDDPFIGASDDLPFDTYFSDETIRIPDVDNVSLVFFLFT